MDKMLLEQVILDQRESFSTKQLNITEREVDLERYKEHDQIVIVSGIRRCGKSTLLKQFAALYQDFHFVNFDDERLISFTVDDFSDLMILFKKRSDSKNIFIDEVQNIPGWERFVRRLHDEGYKIFITGSNSNLLSSELGTHLTGRYCKIELFPFSFREYLLYNRINIEGPMTSSEKAQMLKHFDIYLEKGGFPELLKYNDSEFLSRVYEDIIYRDIIARYKIKTVKQFFQLSHYLFTNFTSDLSYNGVKNTLGIKSPISVKNYIGYLEDSYLAFELYKYDYSLKKQHVNDKKIYVIDNGVRNEVSFRFSEDSGKLLENLVYIELIRNGNSLFMHKGKGECDFIIQDRNKITDVIQVCFNITPANRKRELNGLIEAAKLYTLKSGLILSYDQRDTFDVDGIKIEVIPVWEWLTSKEYRIK